MLNLTRFNFRSYFKLLNNLQCLRLSSTKTTGNEEVSQILKEDPKNMFDRKCIDSYSHNPPQLMEFFDDPKNWGESLVKSGRPWKMDELRIKSNSDLHKLWFVLYKERNMLLTMQENSISESRTMPSEERIEKVEESMANLERVVRERNKAYWQLEVDQTQTGSLPFSYRKDTFGRYFWQACSEHLIPWYINTGFKTMNGPGYGHNVTEFVRRFKEKKMLQTRYKLMGQAYYLRQLMRRFPDLDLDYLQRKYPHIPVKKLKDELQFYREPKVVGKMFKKFNTRTQAIDDYKATNL